MRLGKFKQGINKPSQGCQLRGCSPLTEGLVSCVVFSDSGDSGSGIQSGAHNFGTPIDILNYPYILSSPLFNGNGGKEMGASPWGAARQFADPGDWISYQATGVVNNFPQGASPRTLACLFQLDPSQAFTSQIFQNYGQNATGELFATGFVDNAGTYLGVFDISSSFGTPFTVDANWHLFVVVLPLGSAALMDCNFYLDGMQVGGVLISGTNVALNTIVNATRADESYAIGQRNYYLNHQGGLNFWGLMAGAWVWNYALSADAISLLWRDPFHMIARPRSFFPAVVLPPQAPTCSLSASHTSIGVGQSTVLSWTTQNIPTSASIDNGVGSVTPAIGGSVTVSPTVTTTYTLTVSNSGGSSTCQVTILVSNAPTCTLSANRTTVALGESVILSWTSTGQADSANISDGITTLATGLPPNGSFTTFPTKTTTYVLNIISNQFGSSTCQITITVGSSCAASSLAQTYSQFS